MSEHKDSRIKYMHWALLPVFLVSGYLLFWPSFDSPWLMDDIPVLVNNPDIRSLTNFFDNYYPGRPLRELTYLIDYQFFGLQPTGYHVQQIFWHGLNAWLVFLLSLRLFPSKPVAWGAALLFLVHPLQVEVVANISHRKDILALAFCLVSLLAYLRGRDSEKLNRILWMLAALLFWGVALLAKENALALIVVPVAYELTRPGRGHRKFFLGALSLGIIGVAGRILSLVNNPEFLESIGPALLKLGKFGQYSFEDYFLTVFKAWAFMASKLVWPLNLTMEYTFPVPAGWLEIQVLGGLIGGVLLVALFAWAGWRSHPMCPALAWLLAFWLPTSNLLGHLSYFAADRYWYTPIVGACLLGSYGLWRLCRSNRAVFFMLGCLIVLPLAWLTWQQQEVWSHEEIFYTHMLHVSPDALEGLVGKGVSAMAAGDLDTARHYFRSAVKRSPRDWRVPQNLGLIAYRQGAHADAKGYFQQALAMSPNNPEIHNNLGSMYTELGDPEGAITALRRAITINPHFERGYTNLGVAYERMGELVKAEAMHRRALLERRDYAEAHYNLGVTLYRAGRKDEARESFATASRLSPKDVDALFNYASLASETGRQAEAVAALDRLRQVDPQLAVQLEKEMSGR